MERSNAVTALEVTTARVSAKNATNAMSPAVARMEVAVPREIAAGGDSGEACRGRVAMRIRCRVAK